LVGIDERSEPTEPEEWHNAQDSPNEISEIPKEPGTPGIPNLGSAQGVLEATSAETQIIDPVLLKLDEDRESGTHRQDSLRKVAGKDYHCDKSGYTCMGFQNHPQHTYMHWSECYDDNYLTHYHGKLNRLFPKKTRKGKKKASSSDDQQEPYPIGSSDHGPTS
jgi:hypothetical protein